MKTIFQKLTAILILVAGFQWAGAQAIATHHGMTAAQYQAKFNTYTSQGYRLTSVDGYNVGGNVYFAAIWQKISGPVYVTHHNMTAAQYQAKFNDYTGQGYRLTEISGYHSGGQAMYAAIWEKKSGGAWKAHHGMTTAQYQAKFNEYKNQGYRLTFVEGYPVGNNERYAAIWEKTNGPAYVTHHGMTSDQYQAKFNQYANDGYRLSQVSAYTIGSTDKYAAIWEKTSGAYIARHRMTSSGYQSEFDNQYYSGFRLRSVSGYTLGNQSRYAAIWDLSAVNGSTLSAIDSKINAYKNKHSITGISVAFVKDGRLVFAKGYGYADQGAGEIVDPKNLFRIASISKPITSAAIMKLVQQGKVSLDSKVFGPGSVLGTTYGSQPYSDREKAITVRQLMNHTAGGTQWDNNGDDGSSDPMFTNAGYNHAQLIGWVLDNRTVDATPGTTYHYSNFGYCVLGRVIEKLSGQTYENFVKQNVLGACGISAMSIAGDTEAERKPNEVKYYGGNPYGMKVKRMDSHGGWIASPIDLLRFIVRVDGFNTKPDILSAASINQLFTGSSANSGYGLGWVLGPTSRSHNGALPGTIGYMMRLDNGMSFAVLLNKRPDGDPYANEIKDDLVSICQGAYVWPGYDLF